MHRDNKEALEQWNLDELAERTAVRGNQTATNGLKRRIERWCARGLLINNGLDETLTECYRLARTDSGIAKFVKQVSGDKLNFPFNSFSLFALALGGCRPG